MTPVHVVQGQFSQNARSSVLRSGSMVTGRVLSKNQDGSYTISLAGQKLSVKSEQSFTPGTVFTAKVSVKGERLTLTLVKENREVQPLLQKFDNSSGLTPQVANLLSSLGFEANELSLKILLFMQQIGMKIDVNSAKKALQRAKDSENPEEKSQILLLLEKKGIIPDDFAVSAITGRSQHGREKQNPEQNHKQFMQKKAYHRPIDASDIKKFFSSLDDASFSRKIGILSAFNSIRSSQANDIPLRHWLVFPFDWDFNQSYGNIKMLFDSDLKNLEKVIIDIKSAEKNNVFVLYYQSNRLKSLTFSADSILSDSEKNSAVKKLSAMIGKDIPVSFIDYSQLQGFCCGDELLSSVEGAF